MKTLLLLRHAKSDWGDPAREDFDRPLNVRGRKAARRMAEHIARRGLGPDLVWCSTAARARETWALMAPALEPAIGAGLRDDLYLATAAELLAIARGAPDRAARLMLIAHNPGLHEIALSLARTSRDAGELDALRAGLPTAALAIVAFDADGWAGIADGRLVSLVRPRRLPPGDGESRPGDA